MNVRTYPLPRPARATRRARRLLLALCVVAAVIPVSAPSARAHVPVAPEQAYAPVEVVHTEQVQAGPYHLTVGFSTWPLRAMQSLDFTFAPDGGLTGKSGTLSVTGPGREGGGAAPLSRHPRKRDVWGLDIQSLSTAGKWSFTFVVDGPRGRGTGTLGNVTVLDQPGPPLALSWALCTLPVLGLVAFLTVAWRRNRPSRHLVTMGV
ncbi:hypothetical protein HII36_43950 [Nonomuraea sp. NN258]|uniref:hypothetical protein n=1 Tax=Nonomuraea antri TaxID=2730852 RepID=UPI0015680B7A|nr:hypothetical protein [Nonomuraea antri]NRQ38733.1 hypothetical protein [Nonomuraea antri]